MMTISLSEISIFEITAKRGILAVKKKRGIIIHPSFNYSQLSIHVVVDLLFYLERKDFSFE